MNKFADFAPSKPAPPMPWHALPQAPAVGTLLGQCSSLVDGEVAMLELIASESAPQTPFRYLLLRSGERVHAFVNRCAHFGVPLATRQDMLQFTPHISLTCNVHYARFRWSDGVCDRGDCVGEGLIPIPLDIDGTGAIRIAGA